MSFSVAGLNPSASVNQNQWGSTNTAPENARSQYQSGYLMSSTQSNAGPPDSQRFDDLPVVHTKAKMNHVHARGSTSDFGMDSMFQSSRRQTVPDEDAPPTNSINDMFDGPSGFHQPRDSLNFSRRAKERPSTPSAAPVQPILYVVVFGYPADKYSVTVEYFKSMGDSTDVEASLEIMNCFRIGYMDAGEAMRAVRKNGEVLGGSWMIGAKWADPAQAEAILGYSTTSSPPPMSSTNNHSNAMAVDEPPSSPGSTAFHGHPGTPLRLAPSSAAFRKPGSGEQRAATPVKPMPTAPLAGATTGSAQQKGFLGQASDLIFGW